MADVMRRMINSLEQANQKVLDLTQERDSLKNANRDLANKLEQANRKNEELANQLKQARSGETSSVSSQKSGAYPLENLGQKRHDESSSTNLPQDIEKIPSSPQRRESNPKRELALKKMQEWMREKSRPWEKEERERSTHKKK
jgi:uncharacterized phage infection (PIP) family protein YhgE